MRFFSADIDQTEANLLYIRVHLLLAPISIMKIYQTDKYNEIDWN